MAGHTRRQSNPVLAIVIPVYERLRSTSGIEVKVGQPPDLVGFSHWLSNQTEATVKRFFRCSRVTAWRMLHGKLTPKRFAARAEAWATQATSAMVAGEVAP